MRTARHYARREPDLWISLADALCLFVRYQVKHHNVETIAEDYGISVGEVAAMIRAMAQKLGETPRSEELLPGGVVTEVQPGDSWRWA